MAKVPYTYLSAYIGFVIISSLLVGLLPPFVNRPTCKTDPKAAEQTPVVSNRIHIGRNRREFSEELELCPEFTNPFPGVQPPWTYPRLPTNIIPSHYDIEINILNFNDDSYDGLVSIIVDIKQPVDTFILHKKYIETTIEALTDKEGNELEIGCYGVYEKNDYYIFRTPYPVEVDSAPLTIRFKYTGFLDKSQSGIFELNFRDHTNSKSSLVTTMFEPINARKAYPCFDEPEFKATYRLTIRHPIETIALSNSPFSQSNNLNDQLIETSFSETPKLPSYLIGFAVFNSSDFVFDQDTTRKGREVRILTRKEYYDNEFTQGPLGYAVHILDYFEEYFSEVKDAFPSRIDILAIPGYPNDGISHYGLPIFREDKILFKYETTSQREKQRIAMLMAKIFAELFFGNYVTFSWWDELWLQEAFANFVSYKIIQNAYPDWNINEQFVTNELIQVLVDDAYPSSHPIVKPVNSQDDINSLFDTVEISKASAVLRMMENELDNDVFKVAIITYLEANAGGIGNSLLFFSQLAQIGPWSTLEFSDRWLKQSNYPFLTIRMQKNAGQRLHLYVEQIRAINSDESIFANDNLYPSPFNWIWYIPLKCLFGYKSKPDTHMQKFFISTRNFDEVINDGLQEYDWVHCDLNFNGYFGINYNYENWKNIEMVLKTDHKVLNPIDRSNIIHNLFLNAYSDKLQYEQLVDLISYIEDENDYLPLRTLHKHLNDLIGILLHKKSFSTLSRYFIKLIRNTEASMNEDVWTEAYDPIVELTRETIIDLKCKIQDSGCLRKATDLYNNETLATNEPPFLRQLILNYHFQNTYNIDEWKALLRIFNNAIDLEEKRIYLEALTFTYIPSLLTRLLGSIPSLDYFETMKFLSRNPIGREIAWNNFRLNFDDIINTYGEDDPRIGQLLIDISFTFEREYLNLELISFITYFIDGAPYYARKSLEIVSTNILWLKNKENELVEAFQHSNLI